MRWSICFLAALCLYGANANDTKKPAGRRMMKSGAVMMRPKINEMEEAEHVYFDAFPQDLLAPEQEVQKHVDNIKAIRKTLSPRISKVMNLGRYKLGEVEIKGFNDEMRSKVDSSEYGPVHAVFRTGKSDTSVIKFEKHYNPLVLVKKLNDDLEVKAREIRLMKKDYGHIEYDPEENSYTFREGFENCAPRCVDNHFWVFTFDKDGIPNLDREYATDIPVEAPSPMFGKMTDQQE